jgi:hypothetical protein
MRTLAFGSLMALGACGGTWSNRDLEFAAALPARSTLASNLPVNLSTGQPLRSGPTHSRSDGLNAGDPSRAYAESKKATNDFNGLLGIFLGSLDAIRTVPPTTRSVDGRIWGPFVAQDAPGFQFRVTISLTSSEPTETYGWKIEAQKFSETTWLELVRGSFQASVETVRRGVGTIEVPVKNFRDAITVDAQLQAVESIAIGYQTTTFPSRTQMAFTFAPGNTSEYSQAGYLSEQLEDGSGAMEFTLASTDPKASHSRMRSRWNQRGAGLAEQTILEGTLMGATRIECWNESFRVTWIKESWPTGQEAGRQADCPALP